MAGESPWKTLARAVHAQLNTILAAESRAQPTLAFGNASIWTELTEPPPAVVWVHDGGRFSTSDKLVPASDPPTPTLGVRIAMSEVRIWHISEEHAQHVLDRLQMATNRVAADRFRWNDATYAFRSELVGNWLQNGRSVIVLLLPVWVPVAAEYDGETTPVIIAGNEFRAGIAEDTDDDIEDAEYDVDRIVTGPDEWPT
jgi:hypothetical protein